MFWSSAVDAGRLYWPVVIFMVGAALTGWWCAGFAWRCSRLLRLPARIDTLGGAIIDPHAAVLAALWRLPANGRRARSSGPPLTSRLCIAAVSATSALMLANRYGVGPASAAAVVAVLILLALAVIDGQTGLLPDALTLPLLWLGLALAWADGPVSLHEAVAGAMLGYGFLYALFLAFRVWRGHDGMGHGDFKLAAALGAWVGPLSLAYLLLAASLLGTVYALRRWKARGLSESYAFGPWLAAAGILVLACFPELHSGF